jgi:hypothetical protein
MAAASRLNRVALTSLMDDRPLPVASWIWYLPFRKFANCENEDTETAPACHAKKTARPGEDTRTDGVSRAPDLPPAAENPKHPAIGPDWQACNTGQE